MSSGKFKAAHYVFCSLLAIVCYVGIFQDWENCHGEFFNIVFKFTSIFGVLTVTMSVIGTCTESYCLLLPLLLHHVAFITLILMDMIESLCTWGPLFGTFLMLLLFANLIVAYKIMQTIKEKNCHKK